MVLYKVEEFVGDFFVHYSDTLPPYRVFSSTELWGEIGLILARANFAFGMAMSCVQQLNAAYIKRLYFTGVKACRISQGLGRAMYWSLQGWCGKMAVTPIITGGLFLYCHNGYLGFHEPDNDHFCSNAHPYRKTVTHFCFPF